MQLERREMNAPSFFVLLALSGLLGTTAAWSMPGASSCQGKDVPLGACARLFDKDNCGGWDETM